MSVLDQSKPHQRHFEALCAIPHPSMQEKAVSDYVVSVAKRLGLDYEQDELWNVIVRKPASVGYEHAPAVMLQAHMDMVCVKAPGSSFDFETDPLSLYVDEAGRLHAKDTTLGADDGYGVAYLLAVMEEDFPHPPLELVFTVQEENGCFGVDYLDAGKLTARRMIGLDVMGADIEYTCCVGCFYSDRMVVRKHCEPVPSTGETLTVRVDGIQPVREGALVHPELHNAIKVLARLLDAAIRRGQDICLVSMQGGEAENYNPVCAEAMLSVADKAAFEALVRSEFAVICRELDDDRQDMHLTIDPAQTESMLSAVDTQAIVDLLYLMPSATCQIDVRDGDMTATNNVGMVALIDGQLTITMSDRAKKPGHKEGILRRVETLCRLCSAELETTIRYASWDYQPDSPLLRATADLMRETYGHDMVENICPGGLECGSLIPRMPGLDVVMFAPIGDKCHSTEEYLDLASFDRVYVFLKMLLGRLV